MIVIAASLLSRRWHSRNGKNTTDVDAKSYRYELDRTVAYTKPDQVQEKAVITSATVARTCSGIDQYDESTA